MPDPVLPLIRRTTPDDRVAVGALLDAAFGPSRFESELVAALHASGREMLEWVAAADGRLTGYVAFSRAYRGVEAIGWHVAPVAVDPAQQRRGLGTALLRTALATPPLASTPIFVLGDPAYYGRLGFVPIDQPRCSFDPENMHFRALHWTAGAPFTIGYEPEFGAPTSP